MVSLREMLDTPLRDTCVHCQYRIYNYYPDTDRWRHVMNNSRICPDMIHGHATPRTYVIEELGLS